MAAVLLLPSLGHHAVLNMAHRAWAGAVLLVAIVVLWRGRRARAGVAPIERAVVAVLILLLLQAGLGIVVVAVGESTLVEVAHSSVGSLTWVAVTVLLWLTRTLPPRRTDGLLASRVEAQARGSTAKAMTA